MRDTLDTFDTVVNRHVTKTTRDASYACPGGAL